MTETDDSIPVVAVRKMGAKILLPTKNSEDKRKEASP